MTSETNTAPANSVLLHVLHDKPADGLLAVARLMRERAEAATGGIWGIGNDVNIVSGVKRPGRGVFSCDWHVAEVTADFDREGENGGPNEAAADDDAVHIATMANPAVALALANWLEDRQAAYRAGRGLMDEHAIAVARAYLAADVEERP